MTSRVFAVVPLFLAVGLAGCNANAPSVAQPVVATPASYSGADLSGLPAGAECTAQLTRFSRVINDDVQTGNLNQSVYDKLQVELRPSIAACQGGRSGEAVSILQASRVRHGYRSDNRV